MHFYVFVVSVWLKDTVLIDHSITLEAKLPDGQTAILFGEAWFPPPPPRHQKKKVFLRKDYVGIWLVFDIYAQFHWITIAQCTKIVAPSLWLGYDDLFLLKVKVLEVWLQFGNIEDASTFKEVNA